MKNFVRTAILAQALTVSGCVAQDPRNQSNWTALIPETETGGIRLKVGTAVSNALVVPKPLPPVETPAPAVSEPVREVAESARPIPFVRDNSTHAQTPLAMKGIPQRISEFLGYNQYEAILETENGIEPKEDKKGRKIFDVALKDFPEIKFPTVYYGLEKTFPATLAELEESGRRIPAPISKESGDLILVTKTGEGRTALGYYQSGKLRLATHVSTGTNGHSTPKGVFQASYKESRKRSRLYEDAPMPYAVNVHEHVFMHHGHVDGKPRSHGCVRVPGFYQEVLFREVKPGTKIIISM